MPQSPEELLNVDVAGMSDNEAIETIGHLIDASHDHSFAPGIDRAFALLDHFAARDVSPSLRTLAIYFRANAWEARKDMRRGRDPWAWEQPEIQSEILALREAVRSDGFAALDALRRCQILTNLANQLNSIGRFVEALELWDRATAIASNYPMPIGNRGIALEHYARTVYDHGHAGLLAVAAHDALADATQQFLDEDAPPAQVFRKHANALQTHVDIDALRRTADLTEGDMGGSPSEREYRQWCLEHRLFLNPLNDLGAHPIASHDVLTLPTLTVMGSLKMPVAIGFYNQMKQEFASARYMCFESQQAGEVHFSDRGVRLYNTLDYPCYGLAIEKMKMAFRGAYSILDKVAFFLNDYLALGVAPRQVYFRSLWYEARGPQPRPLLERFRAHRNWPMRGLFWLSKDLFDDEFQEVTEPDARELDEVRNHLEHRYLQVCSSLNDRTQSDAPFPFVLTRDELGAKTLRLVRLARNTLVYLSLAVHREELLRRSTDSGDKAALSIPGALDIWRDEWKA